MASSWSELPKDLLQQIFGRLDLFDHYGFSSVCSSWRSVALHNRGSLRKKFLGLIAPEETAGSETRRLFYPLQCDSNNNNNPPKLPIPHQYYCCGSSFGWLVLVDDSWDMHLFNPLSGKKIELPSSKTLPPPFPGFRELSKYYVHKAVLSSDPTSSETYVLVICAGNRKLAYCNVGDKTWSSIKMISRRDYVDAIFYNQKFYALYNPGGLVACDVSDPRPRVNDISGRPQGEIFWHTRYLVECKGEFFQLKRKIQFDFEKPYDSNSDNENDGYDYYVNNMDHGDDSEEDDKVDDHNGEKVGAWHDESDHGVVDNQKDEKADQSGHGEDGTHNSDQNNLSEESFRGIIDIDKGDNNSQGNGSDHGEVDNHNGGNNEQSDQGEDDNHNADNNEESDESDHEINYESIRRYRTIGFKIFKLTESRQCSNCKMCKKWEKVESLGDNAFFVGYNSSFSLSAPDFLGCKPNSVYFTDSRTPYEGSAEPIRHDIGVYNVEEKSVEAIYPIDSKPMRPPGLFWSTPIPW
ncbi:hypothetical protein FRX31_010864 [Thalictrum thalictroides]|uniref:F-box domain-containing protein n=1 Tax=Thalictrum thalictroides TaxID=46969 RepID=A0A7J6WU39_THATH|nr:hypothetical protein FRX31_010864 [Thalictrum thalictroides]